MSTVVARQFARQSKPKLKITRHASRGHRAHVSYRQPAIEWAPIKDELNGISEAFRNVYNNTEEFTEDFFDEV